MKESKLICRAFTRWNYCPLVCSLLLYLCSYSIQFATGDDYNGDNAYLICNTNVPMYWKSMDPYEPCYPGTRIARCYNTWVIYNCDSNNVSGKVYVNGAYKMNKTLYAGRETAIYSKQISANAAICPGPISNSSSSCYDEYEFRPNDNTISNVKCRFHFIVNWDMVISPICSTYHNMNKTYTYNNTNNFKVSGLRCGSDQCPTFRLDIIFPSDCQGYKGKFVYKTEQGGTNVFWTGFNPDVRSKGGYVTQSVEITRCDASNEWYWWAYKTWDGDTEDNAQWVTQHDGSPFAYYFRGWPYEINRQMVVKPRECEKTGTVEKIDNNYNPSNSVPIPPGEGIYDGIDHQNGEVFNDYEFIDPGEAYISDYVHPDVDQNPIQGPIWAMFDWSPLANILRSTGNEVEGKDLGELEPEFEIPMTEEELSEQIGEIYRPAQIAADQFEGIQSKMPVVPGFGVGGLAKNYSYTFNMMGNVVTIDLSNYTNVIQIFRDIILFFTEIFFWVLMWKEARRIFEV